MNLGGVNSRVGERGGVVVVDYCGRMENPPFILTKNSYLRSTVDETYRLPIQKSLQPPCRVSTYQVLHLANLLQTETKLVKYVRGSVIEHVRSLKSSTTYTGPKNSQILQNLHCLVVPLVQHQRQPAVLGTYSGVWSCG